MYGISKLPQKTRKLCTPIIFAFGTYSLYYYKLGLDRAIITGVNSTAQKLRYINCALLK